MEILIRRAIPVSVHSGDQPITINMVTGTVQDALDKAGVHPAEHDEVYPSPDTYIRPGMKIEHIVVEVKNRAEYREIPYGKDTREDKDLEKGKTEVSQEGENGETELIFEQIYKNGMMTSEELISEVVTKEPVTEITSVGTYVAPPPKKTVKISEIKKSGGSGGGQVSGPTTLDDGVQAIYSVEVYVTAYCSACNGGTRTSSGAYASYGTIAASTSQFPFGTKLFVPGYGYGVVQDTGGFSAGTIDVYLGEREVCNCGNEWNTGYRTVYVIG
jgi:3D (Asp-Asp-Asp) domain-containing protein